MLGWRSGSALVSNPIMSEPKDKVTGSNPVPDTLK